MRPAPLPPELLSLVHHVELNKAGWWDTAIQQVIVAAMWLDEKNLTVEGIVSAVDDIFDTSIAAERVSPQIEHLVEAGVLVTLPDGSLKISESSLHDFQHGLDLIFHNETQAKELFLSHVERCCPGIVAEECWQRFNSDCLIPLVQQFGARTYELFSGESHDLEWEPGAQRFFDHYPGELSPSLRTLITDFLDPKSLVARSYVLRYLNAYFFVEATGLREETLKALAGLRGKHLTFTIFLDTNFLFSVLNLHENPSNETAVLLLALLRRLPQYITVRLYAFPLTSDETHRVLLAVSESLKGIRLTPNVAKAVDSSAIQAISGVGLRFVRACEAAGGPIDPDTYFRPYLTNLQSVLRQNGIEFYNERVDQYLTAQRVVDDILAQYEYENPSPADQQRRYKAIEHDKVLWHFVHDKRRVGIESPLEANFWVVTNDFGFLAFDARKRRVGGDGIPICVHPTDLIQMLQFWEPRTPDFEEALLGSLRLPFLFPEFDSASERVTIDILKALSRYENVGDLSTETITEVLLDQVVRQNISANDNAEQQFEVVNSAIVAQDAQIRSQLETMQQQIEELESRNVDKEEPSQAIQEQLSAERQSTSELSQRLAESQAQVTSIESKVKSLQLELAQQNQDAVERGLTQRFARNWVAIPLASVLVLATIGALVLGRYTGWETWQAGLIVGAALVLIWVTLADWKGTQSPVISRRASFARFHRLKNLVFAGLIVIILGVVANALWDKIRELFQSGQSDTSFLLQLLPPLL